MASAGGQWEGLLSHLRGSPVQTAAGPAAGPGNHLAWLRRGRRAALWQAARGHGPAGQLHKLRAATDLPKAEAPSQEGQTAPVSAHGSGPGHDGGHWAAFTRQLGHHQGKPFLYNCEAGLSLITEWDALAFKFEASGFRAGCGRLHLGGCGFPFQKGPGLPAW